MSRLLGLQGFRGELSPPFSATGWKSNDLFRPGRRHTLMLGARGTASPVRGLIGSREQSIRRCQSAHARGVTARPRQRGHRRAVPGREPSRYRETLAVIGTYARPDSRPAGVSLHFSERTRRLGRRELRPFILPHSSPTQVEPSPTGSSDLRGTDGCRPRGAAREEIANHHEVPEGIPHSADGDLFVETVSCC